MALQVTDFVVNVRQAHAQRNCLTYIASLVPKESLGGFDNRGGKRCK